MATITNLNVKLSLHDQDFSDGLKKAEQRASHFSKQVGKFSGGVESLNNLAQSASLASDAFGGASGNVGTFIGGLGAVSTSISAVTSVTFGLTAAMRTLTASMAANPIGLVVVGIAAAFAAITYAASKFNEEEERIAKINEDNAKALEEVNEKLRDREKILKETPEQTEKRKIIEPLRDANTTNDFGQNIGIDAAEKRLQRIQRIEAESKRLQGVFSGIDDAEKALQEKGLSAVESPDQKETRGFRDSLRKKGLDSSTIDQYERQLIALQEFTHKQEELKAKEDKASAERKQLEESLAEFERAANEAYLSDTDKKIKKLQELGANEKQIAKARADIAKAKEPEERRVQLEKDIADKQRLIGEEKKPESLINQISAIENVKPSAEPAAPRAILKGSAEAALLENRTKTPIEKQTELQKQTLAQLKQQLKVQQDQLAELKKQKEEIVAF